MEILANGIKIIVGLIALFIVGLNGYQVIESNYAGKKAEKLCSFFPKGTPITCEDFMTKANELNVSKSTCDEVKIPSHKKKPGFHIMATGSFSTFILPQYICTIIANDWVVEQNNKIF